MIEVDQMVNGCGLTCLAGTQFNVGAQLAGQRITLRMDGPLMTLIDATGTMPCPVPPAERHNLRGTRSALIPARPADPVTTARQVSGRGSIMVAKQENPCRHDPRQQDRHRDRRQRPLHRHRRQPNHRRRPRATATEISRDKACATQRSRSGGQHFGPRR